MHPTEELRRLGLRKAAVQVRIALRRTQCVSAATELARPFGWVDRVVAWWRSVPPGAKWFSASGVAILAKTFLPRLSTFKGLVKFARILMRVARSFAEKRGSEAGVAEPGTT